MGERDGWILVAARWPEKIPEFMADKRAQLDDPRTVRLYRLIGELAEVGVDDDRLIAVADLMAEMIEQSADSGELDQQSEEMNDERSSPCSTRSRPTPTRSSSDSRS